MLHHSGGHQPRNRRRCRGGAEIVFLSAGNDEVARVYARLGFERVGTAGLASPVVSS